MSSEQMLTGLLERAIDQAGGLRALARQLDWDHGNLARVRAGERISPYRASQLAELAGMHTGPAIAAALLQQSKSDAERDYWHGRWISGLTDHKVADQFDDGVSVEDVSSGRPTLADAQLLDSVRDGFGLDGDEDLAAVLSMSLKEVSEIRTGSRRLTIFERLKILDRTGAIKTRKMIQTVLPAQVADGLEKWVHRTMQAEAKKSRARASASRASARAVDTKKR